MPVFEITIEPAGYKETIIVRAKNEEDAKEEALAICDNKFYGEVGTVTELEEEEYEEKDIDSDLIN